MTAPAVQTACRMSAVLDNEALSKVKQLFEELRAIEHWDAEYWRTRHRKGYEKAAFVARQKRRAEILSQLVDLISPGWTF